MDKSWIKASYASFARKLHTPFRSAKHNLSMRSGFLIKLESESGIGIGEASPLEKSSKESFEEVKNFLLQTNAANLLSLWEDFDSQLSPSLRMAIDSAIIRMKDTPFKNPVKSNAIIGITSSALEEAKKFWNEGFRTFKFKVVPETTVQCLDCFDVLNSLSKTSGEAYHLRLDSNHSFHQSEIVDFASGLSAYPIEYWEDPIPLDDRWAWKYFRKESKFPIAIDEACSSLEALDGLLEENLADYFILKPTVLGGFRITEKAIKKILSRGKKYRVTTSLETEVGTSSIIQFLSTIGSPSHVHGLSTGSFFEQSHIPVVPEYKESPALSKSGEEWISSLEWKALP